MQITIWPSVCEVQGTIEEFNWVNEVLTFKVPGAQYSNLYKKHRWDGKKRFFDARTKTFSIGLLGYVTKKGNLRQIKITDARSFPKVDTGTLTLNTIDIHDPKRQYQLDVIEACISNKNCLIEAATNAGKTAIFSGLVKKLHPAPTLILTHSKDLLKQIVEYIETYTGLQCGFITASDTHLRPVTVAMVKTLLNRLGVDQEVDMFFESLKCVIHDEVHHAQAKQFTDILSACQAPFRWGFSGTVPPEKDYNGVLVRQSFGPVAFKISNDELIDLGISAKPKIHLYEIDTLVDMKYVRTAARLETSQRERDDEANDVHDYLKKKKRSYYERYFLKKTFDLVLSIGVVTNVERNGKALDVINKNPGKSVLIVVDYIEHGRLIEQMFKDNKIEAVFISGKSLQRAVALDDFKAGKLKVLIATSIVNEGIDISRISVLVYWLANEVVASYYKGLEDHFAKKTG